MILADFVESLPPAAKSLGKILPVGSFTIVGRTADRYAFKLVRARATDSQPPFRPSSFLLVLDLPHTTRGREEKDGLTNGLAL
jgi:hypothetical protein